jgi:hypothetical protein
MTQGVMTPLTPLPHADGVCRKTGLAEFLIFIQLCAL